MTEKYLLVSPKVVYGKDTSYVRLQCLASNPFYSMAALHAYAKEMGYDKYSHLTIYTL